MERGRLPSDLLQVRLPLGEQLPQRRPALPVDRRRLCREQGDLRGGGEPGRSRHWSRAAAKHPLSPYTWTLGSFAWSPPAGFYTLRLRARDGLGNDQSAGQNQSYPTGASGYQQLTVLVR